MVVRTATPLVWWATQASSTNMLTVPCMCNQSSALCMLMGKIPHALIACLDPQSLSPFRVQHTRVHGERHSKSFRCMHADRFWTPACSLQMA